MLQLLVLVVFSLICYPAYSTEVLRRSADNYSLVDIRSTGTALNLGDDGVSGNIPLGFNFRLFGRTFNSVWISNNGVISFTNGNISGYDSAPLNTLNFNYNYALFPLWTDIINNGDSHSPSYRIDSNTAIFGWYDVSEYGDRSKRSSFEVQLWNTNSFQFRYSSVQLNNQSFTIGYTGDISAGEYIQWYRHPGGMYSAENFGFYSDALTQCNINPLYSVDCPGYEQAYTQKQCEFNPLYSNRCLGYEQALLEQNCSINPLYSSACSGYSQAMFEQTCRQNPLSSAQCPGYNRAIARQVSRIESAPVDINPVDSSQVQPTIDVGGVELNTTGEIQISSSLPAVVRDSVARTEVLGTGLLSRTTSTRTSLAVDRLAVDAVNYSLAMENNRNANMNLGNQELPETVAAIAEEPKRQPTVSVTMSSGNLNSTSSIESTTEQRLNASTTIADLGVGVSMESLSRTGANLGSYTSIQLKDGNFYAPREIYRGQVTVDNARAQRLLNGASDILHQRMIEDQYLLGK